MHNTSHDALFQDVGLRAQSLAVLCEYMLLFLCFCAAACPNQKHSKLPHPPIYYHVVIYCTVHLRYSTKVWDVGWLRVSIRNENWKEYDLVL